MHAWAATTVLAVCVLCSVELGLGRACTERKTTRTHTQKGVELRVGNIQMARAIWTARAGYSWEGTRVRNDFTQPRSKMRVDLRACICNIYPAFKQAGDGKKRIEYEEETPKRGGGGGGGGCNGGDVSRFSSARWPRSFLRSTECRCQSKKQSVWRVPVSQFLWAHGHAQLELPFTPSKYTIE